MKVHDIAARCFKARVLSWLTTTEQGVILPTTEGGSVVISIYRNGRYVEPEPLRIPDDASDLWGLGDNPDGPPQEIEPGDDV